MPPWSTVVGLLTLLVVGGCVGLISFGVAQVMKPLPSYATKSEISRRHAADLRLIQTALAEGNLKAAEKSLSPEVMAVFRERRQPAQTERAVEQQDTQDVLGRHAFTGHSWRVANGGGVGTLTVQGQTIACEVISVDDPSASAGELQVFFRDHQMGAVERQ